MNMHESRHVKNIITCYIALLTINQCLKRWVGVYTTVLYCTVLHCVCVCVYTQ